MVWELGGEGYIIAVPQRPNLSSFAQMEEETERAHLLSVSKPIHRAAPRLGGVAASSLLARQDK